MKRLALAILWAWIALRALGLLGRLLFDALA